jgi:uncharacterized membrane protein
VGFRSGNFQGAGPSGHHGLAGLLALIGFVVIVAGLIWLIVMVRRIREIKTLPGSAAASPSPQKDGARAILDERFARGEIDEGEYTWRRGLLEGGD